MCMENKDTIRVWYNDGQGLRIIEVSKNNESKLIRNADNEWFSPKEIYSKGE